MESSTIIAAPHFKDPECALAHERGVKATPLDVSASAHKRLLIFYQSGVQIRLLSDTFCSPYQDRVIMLKIPVGSHKFPGDKFEAGLLKVSLAYKSEGGDIHEDTEEISAFLYSDSFRDDDNGEGDELTSTGHSPSATVGGNEVHVQVRELTEEVASTDGSNKRHKVLDGGYKKSSLLVAMDSLKLASFCNYDDDVESSCAEGRDLDKDIDSNLSIRQKQAKVRETLRIIASLFPGIKSKHPLCITGETLNYLRSLRDEAEALGFGGPEIQWSGSP